MIVAAGGRTQVVNLYQHPPACQPPPPLLNILRFSLAGEMIAIRRATREDFAAIGNGNKRNVNI